MIAQAEPIVSQELILLRERYMFDICKPDVDKFDRAVIIQNLIKNKGWTQREFARQYGLSNATVQDWLLYTRIEEKEYNTLIDKGFKVTDIYRSLREKRGKVEAGIPVIDIDVWLVEIRNKLRHYKKELLYTPKTMSLIDDAVNELNIYGAAINSKQKKK